MKRKELKRAAAGLMAVALCMGLTAFPVFAGGTEIGRSVTVVEDGGKRTVLGLDEKGEGSGWSYGGNMVLTLDGFTGEQIRLNGGSPDGKDLFIELVGDNTITGTDSLSGVHSDYNSFYDENRIIFTGSGDLEITNTTSSLGSPGKYIFGQDGVVTLNHGELKGQTTLVVQSNATVNINENTSGSSLPSLTLTINGGIVNLYNKQQIGLAYGLDQNKEFGNICRITEDGLLTVKTGFSGEAPLLCGRGNEPLPEFYEHFYVTTVDGRPTHIQDEGSSPSCALVDENGNKLTSAHIRGNGSYVYNGEDDFQVPEPEDPGDGEEGGSQEKPGTGEGGTDPEKPGTGEGGTDPEKPGTGEDDNVVTDSNGHKATDSNAHSSSSGSGGGYGPGKGYGYYAVRNEAGPGQPVGDSRWNGGQWRQDTNGWWFAGTDGSYPKAGWAQLEWNGQKLWYHFDANGYMSTGWIQDDGNWYYLHAEGDGNRGFMHTGWQEIGGKWYYFHKDTDGAALPVGAMLSNTVTPDGYTVGSDGAWI